MQLQLERSVLVVRNRRPQRQANSLSKVLGGITHYRGTAIEFPGQKHKWSVRFQAPSTATDLLVSQFYDYGNWLSDLKGKNVEIIIMLT